MKPLNRNNLPTPVKSPAKRKKSLGGPEGHQLACVLYGPPGIGKTSICAQFERPGFVCDPFDKGLQDLLDFRQCPKPELFLKPRGFETLLEACDEIAQSDCEAAIFDNLSGFQRVCFDYHCEKYYANDWTSTGFYSYQSGPNNAAQKDWPRLITKLNDIREAGKHVILIAHSEVKPVNRPDGVSYDQYQPMLHKGIWGATHQWASTVLFYNSRVETKKEGGKNKADEDTAKRLIFTSDHPAFVAKNRYGLEPVIDAGSSGKEAYEAFAEAYRKASPSS